jgi:asparagine synthase (glutamine-hydrolysing)
LLHLPLAYRFQQFPPGHYYSSKTTSFTRYYNPQFYLEFEASPPQCPSTPYDAKVLREAFEAAVVKRMMSDVPFGECLLCSSTAASGRRL